MPLQSLFVSTEPQCLHRASVPSQSLSACTEPQCLYRTSLPVEVCTLVFTFLYSNLRCNTFCFRSTYWLCHLYTVLGMLANEDMKLTPFNFLCLPENGWKMPFLIPGWKTIFLSSLAARQNKFLFPNQTRSDWLRPGRSGIESRRERDFPPVQAGPEAHPTSCKMCTEYFQGVKCGRGVLLTTHPLLVPRSWKSRAILLHTLWATPAL